MSQVKRPVAIAVIGVGRMGRRHAQHLWEGRIQNARLAGLCDTDAAARYGFPGVGWHSHVEQLFNAGGVDAVLIATPHDSHATLSRLALACGLHVLSEKPMAVDCLDAQSALDAYQCRPRAEQVYGVAFGMRFDPRFVALRAALSNQNLGQLERIQWTATDWFRTDAYYRTNVWRGSWKGEGGGLLVNQAPHQLDIWSWLFGLPKQVQATCAFGQFHQIEVDDQVAASFQYADGYTASFVSSTGEAPGVNRLEVIGDRAQWILDGQRLTVTHRLSPLSEHRRTAEERSIGPMNYRKTQYFPRLSVSHHAVLQNFVNAILGTEQLSTPAQEALASVELSNAIFLSSLLERAVTLPLDKTAFKCEFEQFRQRVATLDRVGQAVMIER